MKSVLDKLISKRLGGDVRTAHDYDKVEGISKVVFSNQQAVIIVGQALREPAAIPFSILALGYTESGVRFLDAHFRDKTLLIDSFIHKFSQMGIYWGDLPYGPRFYDLIAGDAEGWDCDLDPLLKGYSRYTWPKGLINALVAQARVRGSIGTILEHLPINEIKSLVDETDLFTQDIPSDAEVEGDQHPFTRLMLSHFDREDVFKRLIGCGDG